MARKCASTARARIRIYGGCYRRERPSPQEISDKEVRVVGSKADLLGTPAAASGGNRLRLAFAILFRLGGPRTIAMITTFSLWPSDGGGGAGETGSAQGIVNEGGDFNESDKLAVGAAIGSKRRVRILGMR